MMTLSNDHLLAYWSFIIIATEGWPSSPDDSISFTNICLSSSSAIDKAFSHTLDANLCLAMCSIWPSPSVWTIRRRSCGRPFSSTNWMT